MRHDHHAPKFGTFSRIFSALALLASAGAAAAAPQEGPPAEQGLWFNHTGKGAVEIRPCGTSGPAADRLCGFIVWLKDPNKKNGEPLTDGYNADPAKRKRPICGLPVLGSLRPMSDGSWDQGWVYDPEQGQQFDAAIQLKSQDRLVLTGYKGVKFFSKSFIWKRAPDDLPRCDGLNKASAGDRQARAEAAGQVAAPRPVPAVRPGTAAAQ